ncbi:thioesterase II family protein [Streptomyces sp. NPDC001599]|uniref:thioesterase II family protein n=1 Tax=Streptomyces sp. NPDC001599 TaxID=3364591 RepID=UPI00369F723D
MLLYCFPHAGGADSPYRSWGDRLAPVEVRVLGRGARLPGRAATTPDSVAALAEACADHLAAERRPYAFLGHSLGALIAFETARSLRARGGPGPAVLFATGHVAPHLPSPGRKLAELPTPEFWAEVCALGGTAPELLDHAALREAAEPGLRAEFRASENYRYIPGRPLDCRIVALAGTDDDRAPADQCAPWRLHTTGSFAQHTVSGGHFFVADNPEPVLRTVREEAAAPAR